MRNYRSNHLGFHISRQTDQRLAYPGTTVQKRVYISPLLKAITAMQGSYLFESDLK